MEEFPKTTEEANAHVARDAVATFVFVLVYAGVVLLLASRLRWLAVALFWLGVVLGALPVIRATFGVARTVGRSSSGSPHTRIAALTRVVELFFVLSVLYYLYIDLY
jgi:hypothetical protein